jgi:phosphoglycolate phosphatase
MKTVFLDLDGTLTDPKVGITGSVNHALAAMGHAPLDPDTMGWVIGPALIDTFTRLGVADPEKALLHYRERYTATGLFENTPYPGLTGMLGALRDSGYRLCLATAKPISYAARITAHFGITPFMTAEFGPGLDGSLNNKADLLAHALTQTGARAEDCVMVGDRIHDFRAARRNGMASVAVTWGYGTPDEHAEASHICTAMADLPALIGRILPARR